MATLKLNIYGSDKKTIVKTHTAETYDLMLGTVEDLMNIIDVDKMTDNMAIATAVVKCYKQLTPLLKDVFPNLTDEELKNVKAKELIPLFKNLGTTIIEDLGLIQSGN